MVRIETMLSELFARVAPGIHTEDPMLTSMLQWFGSVQHSALDRWRTVARSGVRCSLRHGNGALPAPCEHPAVGACGLCREPVCLPHAAVAMNGQLTCLRCMAAFADVARERVRARSEPREAPPPPASAPPLDEAALQKKHLRTLGLAEAATWDEVRAQYRKLALKYHPDRAPEGKRGAASRKMAQINAAHQWLQQHLRKAA